MDVIPTYRRTTPPLPYPGTPPSPVQVDAATPVVTSIEPTSAAIGGANFTLRVLGTFIEGATILWNGSAEPTTFVSPTELTTGVNMATATTPGPIPVAVQFGAGLRSNEVVFDLQPAAEG